jgi:hypothetical protein
MCDVCLVAVHQNCYGDPIFDNLPKGKLLSLNLNYLILRQLDMWPMLIFIRKYLLEMHLLFLQSFKVNDILKGAQWNKVYLMEKYNGPIFYVQIGFLKYITKMISKFILKLFNI